MTWLFWDLDAGPSVRLTTRRGRYYRSAGHWRLFRPLAIEILEDRCVPSSYQFTTFDPPGSTFTQGHKLNASRAIVGDYIGADSIRHGFLLHSDGSFTQLDKPGSTFTQALGINISGDIVGQYVDASGKTQGFIRSVSDGNYATFNYPGSTFTSIYDINAYGQFVGGYTDTGGRQHGFVVTDGNPTMIDPPDSTATTAAGINDAGQIVGGYRDAGGTPHGFLLASSAYTRLDAPSSTATYAYGINNVGQIVGQYNEARGQPHGFLRLTDGSYTTIDVPGASDNNANGINDCGLIVGSYDDGSGRSHGYLATPTLTATGTTLSAKAGHRFAAVVASFTDCSPNPGAATDYSAVVDWGDGSSLSTGGITDNGGGNYDVAASHTYAAAGEYQATITITDNRDPSRTATAYTTIHVGHHRGGHPPAPHGQTTTTSTLDVSDLDSSDGAKSLQPDNALAALAPLLRAEPNSFLNFPLSKPTAEPSLTHPPLPASALEAWWAQKSLPPVQHAAWTAVAVGRAAMPDPLALESLDRLGVDLAF